MTVHHSSPQLGWSDKVTVCSDLGYYKHNAEEHVEAKSIVMCCAATGSECTARQAALVWVDAMEIDGKRSVAFDTQAMEFEVYGLKAQMMGYQPVQEDGTAETQLPTEVT